MYRSGIAQKLVEVAEAMLGRTRGGLGLVNVGASTMFGAVSGSAIASASAMGATLMPLMKQKGYDADYAVNVTSTAAIVGLLIPPSHNMIIYSAASGIGVPIGDLFLAGVVPGLVTAAILMTVAWLVAVKRGYARGEFPGWRAFAKAILVAIPGLMAAVIIMGGILSGIFTATESSAVAVIYTVLVGAFVYRSLGWTRFAEAAMQSVKVTAMVLLIIGAATAFGYALAVLEAPSQLAELITSITRNPLLVLLILNVMLLVLGTFMDMSPLIVITTPILLPVVMEVGVDPVHFGIIMMLNLGIGLVTPPVGSVLFVGAAVGGLPVEKAVKTIWPFYLALVGALLLITYIPALSLTLPGMFK
jgi:tripartite ATP-independent transporter DctM subunit